MIQAPSTLLEDLENGGVTLKTRQMISIHNTQEEFKSATITGHSGFVLEKGKSHDW